MNWSEQIKFIIVLIVMCVVNVQISAAQTYVESLTIAGDVLVDDAISVNDVIGKKLPAAAENKKIMVMEVKPVTLPVNTNEPTSKDIPDRKETEKKKPLKTKMVKKPVKKKKNKYKNKVAQARIFYTLDEAVMDADMRREITKALEKSNKKKIKSIHISTQTIWGPFDSLQNLGRHRAKYIKALMREQGINPEDYMLSEIHIKTTGKQTASVELTYK